MKLFFLTSLLWLTSCAGIQSSYPEGIKVEKLISTSNNREMNHGSAIDWIAMNFQNSNQVIKVNDKERGKIVLKGLIDCGITNSGASINVTLNLNLAISSSDKSVRISMPNITSTDGWNYPRTDEQASEVKTCLNEKILSPLEKALM